MKKAIILAAGRGSRLVQGLDFPKPLIRVAGVPLIVRVIRNLELSGINEIGIVVGYQAYVLIRALQRYTFRPKITFIHNAEWTKPNGTSALKAKDFVTGPTFLMMCDHLWSPSILSSVSKQATRGSAGVLGVDFNIARCPDLEDATKVCIDEQRITDISKELVRYDALDTGVFAVTPQFMKALESVDGPEGCSLSAGVSALAKQGDMHVADVGDALWVDVDTVATLRVAEKLLARFSDTLEPLAPTHVQPMAAVAM